MKQLLLCKIVIAFCFVFASQVASAQNGSPYWSLAGNSNAGAASKLGTTVYQPIRFLTNNLERMRLSSGGSLGINTTTPAVRLHIRQSEANRAVRYQHESQADYWNSGIGTNTLNLRFEFNSIGKGQVSSVDGTFSTISDLRLKEDVEALPSVMDKVLQLKPSSYYFKDSRTRVKHKSIGFISQDVEQLFPELIQNDDAGYKLLSYSQFAVIAIKAIQEQQAQINELKDIIKTLNADRGNASSDAWMKQSNPNPANSSATIQYFVPADVRAARILLTNSKGQQINLWNLNKGTGTINVNSGVLSAGTYQYTLVTDGKTIQTKKMVIVR